MFATNFVMVSDVGVSAKAIALGNTVGHGESAAAVFDNAAALSNVKGNSIALFSTQLFDEVSYFNVALSSYTKVGTIAVGLYEQSVQDIPATTYNSDSQVESIGTYDWKNSIVKIAYQTYWVPTILKNSLFSDPKSIISAAVTYSCYNLNFESYSGVGQNLDVGILTKIKNIDYSVNIQNVFFNQYVAYNNNQLELLPFTMTFSAMIPYKWFEIIPQYKSTRSRHLFAYGVSYQPGFLPYVSILTGFKQQLDYLNTKHNKYSIGIALNLFELSLHYAYERSEYYLLDHQNYFSLSYNI
tara:strand:- start:232 stop:1125 length:894 start_codon:yes stop_codon:yes gene_type:complete